VVPSGDTIENVRVAPFTGVEVEDDEVAELAFSVPATV
jgi:hypothetical protein